MEDNRTAHEQQEQSMAHWAKVEQADYRALQAREFWERAYVADMAAKPDSSLHEIAADLALSYWRARFDPKASE